MLGQTLGKRLEEYYAQQGDEEKLRLQQESNNYIQHRRELFNASEILAQYAIEPTLSLRFFKDAATGNLRVEVWNVQGEALAILPENKIYFRSLQTAATTNGVAGNTLPFNKHPRSLQESICAQLRKHKITVEKTYNADGEINSICLIQQE